MYYANIDTFSSLETQQFHDTWKETYQRKMTTISIMPNAPRQFCFFATSNEYTFELNIEMKWLRRLTSVNDMFVMFLGFGRATTGGCWVGVFTGGGLGQVSMQPYIIESCLSRSM